MTNLHIAWAMKIFFFSTSLIKYAGITNIYARFAGKFIPREKSSGANFASKMLSKQREILPTHTITCILLIIIDLCIINCLRCVIYMCVGRVRIFICKSGEEKSSFLGGISSTLNPAQYFITALLRMELKNCRSYSLCDT